MSSCDIEASRIGARGFILFCYTSPTAISGAGLVIKVSLFLYKKFPCCTYLPSGDPQHRSNDGSPLFSSVGAHIIKLAQSHNKSSTQ